MQDKILYIYKTYERRPVFCSLHEKHDPQMTSIIFPWKLQGRNRVTQRSHNTEGTTQHTNERFGGAYKPPSYLCDTVLFDDL